jgi:hypothetical protein
MDANKSLKTTNRRWTQIYADTVLLLRSAHGSLRVLGVRLCERSTALAAKVMSAILKSNVGSL